MFDINAAIAKVFWHNMAEVKQEVVEHRKAGMRLPKKVAGQMGNHVFMQIEQLRHVLSGDGYAIRRTAIADCTFQTVWKVVRLNKDGVHVAHVHTHRCGCWYCCGVSNNPIYMRRSFLEIPWNRIKVEPIDRDLVNTQAALTLDQWGLTVVLY